MLRTPPRTQRLEELKNEGHELIDQLVDMGVVRSKVYIRLRKRLKRQHDLKAGHFRYITIAKDAEVLVTFLKEWIQQKKITEQDLRTPKKPRLKPEYAHGPLVFPVYRKPSLWKRSKLKLRNYLYEVLS